MKTHKSPERKSRARSSYQWRWALLGVAVIVAALALWLVPPEVGSPAGLSERARAEDVGRVRTAMLAFGAGILAVVGAFLTADNVRVGRDANATARRGQFTDRFTKAVELLSRQGNAPVRIGAIHALDSIGRESPLDQPAVVGVLCSHLRERAALDSGFDMSAAAHTEPGKEEYVDQEIDAAVSAIVTRNTDDDAPDRLLDLTSLALAGVRLRRGSLKRVLIGKSDLRGAILTDVDFGGCHASNALLGRATVHKCRASEAFVIASVQAIHSAWAACEMREVNARNALFLGAVFEACRFERWDLRGASFIDAILADTTLSECNLVGAQFENVTVDDVAINAGRLRASGWSDSQLRRVRFDGLALEHVTFETTTMDDVDFGNADLRSASIDVETCHFRDVDMSRATITADQRAVFEAIDGITVAESSTPAPGT